MSARKQVVQQMQQKLDAALKQQDKKLQLEAEDRRHVTDRINRLEDSSRAIQQLFDRQRARMATPGNEGEVKMLLQRCNDSVMDLVQECHAGIEDLQHSRVEIERLKHIVTQQSNQSEQAQQKVELLAKNVVKAVKEKNAMEQRCRRQDAEIGALRSVVHDLEQEKYNHNNQRVNDQKHLLTKLQQAEMAAKEARDRQVDVEEECSARLRKAREDHRRVLEQHEASRSELMQQANDARLQRDEALADLGDVELLNGRLTDELQCGAAHARMLEERLSGLQSNLIKEQRRVAELEKDVATYRMESQLAKQELALARGTAASDGDGIVVSDKEELAIEVVRLQAALEHVTKETAEGVRHAESQLQSISAQHESAVQRCRELESSLSMLKRELLHTVHEKNALAHHASALQQRVDAHVRDIRVALGGVTASSQASADARVVDLKELVRLLGNHTYSTRSMSQGGGDPPIDTTTQMQRMQQVLRGLDDCGRDHQELLRALDDALRFSEDRTAMAGPLAIMGPSGEVGGQRGVADIATPGLLRSESKPLVSPVV